MLQTGRAAEKEGTQGILEATALVRRWGARAPNLRARQEGQMMFKGQKQLLVPVKDSKPQLHHQYIYTNHLTPFQSY